MEIKVYDMLVFEDTLGNIYQDCVCAIINRPWCIEVDAIYAQGVADGNPEHRNEKGELKYECDINDSQIPGIPLPGTYQYGRPVTVLNKEDFE